MCLDKTLRLACSSGETQTRKLSLLFGRDRLLSEPVVIEEEIEIVIEVFRAGYRFVSTFIDFYQHQRVEGTDMEVQKQY